MMSTDVELTLPANLSPHWPIPSPSVPIISLDVLKTCLDLLQSPHEDKVSCHNALLRYASDTAACVRPPSAVLTAEKVPSLAWTVEHCLLTNQSAVFRRAASHWTSAWRHPCDCIPRRCFTCGTLPLSCLHRHMQHTSTTANDLPTDIEALQLRNEHRICPRILQGILERSAAAAAVDPACEHGLMLQLSTAPPSPTTLAHHGYQSSWATSQADELAADLVARTVSAFVPLSDPNALQSESGELSVQPSRPQNTFVLPSSYIHAVTGTAQTAQSDNVHDLNCTSAVLEYCCHAVDESMEAGKGEKHPSSERFAMDDEGTTLKKVKPSAALTNCKAKLRGSYLKDVHVVLDSLEYTPPSFAVNEFLNPLPTCDCCVRVILENVQALARKLVPTLGQRLDQRCNVKACSEDRGVLCKELHGVRPRPPLWKWGTFTFCYYGPCGSGTSRHIDVIGSNSWSVNVDGVKSWCFYDNSSSAAEAPRGSGNVDNDDVTSDRRPRCNILTYPGDVVCVASAHRHSVVNVPSLRAVAGTRETLDCEVPALSVNRNWIHPFSLHHVACVLSHDLEHCVASLRDLKSVVPKAEWQDMVALVLRSSSNWVPAGVVRFFGAAHYIAQALVQYSRSMVQLPECLGGDCRISNAISAVLQQPLCHAYFCAWEKSAALALEIVRRAVWIHTACACSVADEEAQRSSFVHFEDSCPYKRSV